VIPPSPPPPPLLPPPGFLSGADGKAEFRLIPNDEGTSGRFKSKSSEEGACGGGREPGGVEEVGIVGKSKDMSSDCRGADDGGAPENGADDDGGCSLSPSMVRSSVS